MPVKSQVLNILLSPESTAYKMKEFEIIVKDREGQINNYPIPELDVALNLMELLKALELPVKGTCGGMALCASCHIYVHSDHHLPEMSNDEIMMLEQTFHQKSNSRLACQIPVSSELDKLEIELAPED